MSIDNAHGKGDHRQQLCPSHLEITNEARETLGLAMRDLAKSTGLPIEAVLDFIDMEAYWNADTGNLLCVLRLSDNGQEDTLVEIPESHWDFKQVTHQTH